MVLAKMARASRERVKEITHPLFQDHQKGKNDAKDNQWRTSSTFWLKNGRYDGLKSINDRTAAITRLPLDHQEDVQVSFV